MSCTDYRDELVAYARGELAPLAHQRLASHLGRCEGCRALAAALDQGLGAARAWDPVADPGELEALSHRLSPYVEAAAVRRAAPRRLALAGIAAAVIAGSILVVAGRARDGAWPWGAAPAAPLAPGFVAGAPAAQLSPSRFVRVVADASWDGTQGGGPVALSYRMARGAAAFAFDGGGGRTLTVETPFGAVRAVGTRFAVAVAPAGDAVAVSVSDGEVLVERLGGSTSVRAGEEASFAAGGETRRGPASAGARALLDDPFFGSVGRAGHPSLGYDFGGMRIGVALELAAPRRRPSADLLARLERAEALALAGDDASALAIYAACAGQRGLERGYADLCRYEAARIVGFGQGDRAKARSMLAPLARGGEGEVRRQARLALCELGRLESPCRGLECLRALAADDHADEGLRREARRLGDRWAADGGCSAGGDPP